MWGGGVKIIQTKLPQVLLLEPAVHKDSRGFFMEMYSVARYCDAGISMPFVQDNISASGKNVVRGLHYQLKHPQGKLVQVLRGSVFDVVVDVRTGSPTLGQWVSFELSADNNRQVYIPPGFAHGYCTLSDNVIFHYKCTEYYHPEDEHGVLWSDQDVGVDWPVKDVAIVSAKDSGLVALREIPLQNLPVYLL